MNIEEAIALLDQFTFRECPNCQCNTDWREYFTEEEIGAWIKHREKASENICPKCHYSYCNCKCEVEHEGI